ncbi:MAG TPA: pyridoxamine 5'-phosphate oxidase family protein [Candidatus Binataceae bacterium]|nr:pyridoxamine 5'-phosphate oxidase family protein [Candidatus Binataceae bacterium]
MKAEKQDTRKAIRMTPAEATDWLDHGLNLSLATLGRDGYAHLVAMSYAVDNGDIVMTSYGRAQKVINLRRDPRATVMVESGKAYNTLRGVMIRGRAELVEGADAVLEVMRMIGRRMAKLGGGPAEQPDAGDYGETARRNAGKRVVIRIHPEKWASWDHSKITSASH